LYTVCRVLDGRHFESMVNLGLIQLRMFDQHLRVLHRAARKNYQSYIVYLANTAVHAREAAITEFDLSSIIIASLRLVHADLSTRIGLEHDPRIILARFDVLAVHFLRLKQDIFDLALDESGQ
jgi:hypothetical protein